jgi:hypothetical protein
MSITGMVMIGLVIVVVAIIATGWIKLVKTTKKTPPGA